MNKQQEIQKCKQEINELQHRLNILSDRVNKLSMMDNTETAQSPIMQQTKLQKSQSHHAKQKVKKEKAPVLKENIEGNIGKNLFAIIASILILMGVGIFISTIYEYIPEFVKIIAIYLFGFVMIGVGIGVYFKNKNNFWLGLASCGTAELLVSIITSYTYFEVISLPVTFALIIAWVIGTFALTNVKPMLFKIIGYIGFIISIVLGLSLVKVYEGETVLFLFCAYVFVNFIFSLTHEKLSVLNTIIMYAGMLLLVLFVTEDYYILIEKSWGLKPYYLKLDFYSVLTIVGFNIVHLLKYGRYKVSYALFSAISAILITCCWDLEMTTLYPTMMVVFSGLWVLNVVKCGANKASLIYELITISVISLLTLFACFAENTFFIISIMIPVLTLTLTYLKTHDYVSGWFALIAFVFIFATELPDILLCMICFVFAWMLCALTRHEQKLGLTIKNGWYLWGLYSVIAILGYTSDKLTTGDISWWLENLINDGCLALAFFACTAINLYRTLTIAYTKEHGFKQNAESIFLYAINGIIFWLGLNVLGPNEMELLPTLVIILVNFAIISVTLLQSLKTNWNNQNLTMIHCIKFTFYFWFLMITFEAEMVFINAVMLLFAVASIILGFKVKSKPARIYGLVLSLLSSVSLVLFSVSFDSTLQVAGGIILCGLLCFVISFIYSKASKALDSNEKS